MLRGRTWLIISLLALASGCDERTDGAFNLAFISTSDNLFETGSRLTEGAQHLRGATALGLVTRDTQGEIIPGLADRWIVTDDGRSFIFRLRDGTWPDGSPLTAQSARQALLVAMRALDGTSMALDLEPVDEIRAMAGRVIEMRLSAPFPALLQLLAQPELAIKPEAAAGDMEMTRDGAEATLALKPPAARGLPELENWRADTRQLRIVALSAPEALARFDQGNLDAVFGGGIGTLPLVDTGPLSRGAVRVDPATGLFGLAVLRENGPLAQPLLREAIAMAIDRQALVDAFGVGGWVVTTRIVNPGLNDDPGFISERWVGQTIDDLRSESRRRLALWRARQINAGIDKPLRLTIALESGPGYDLLYRELRGQLEQVEIDLVRAHRGQPADLALVDRIARYAAPRWFLNQFRCELRPRVCDPAADELIKLAQQEPDPVTRGTLLAEAEAELTMANIFIPIAAPLRWSLIRGDIVGFTPNRWAFHPLPPMAQIAR